MSLEQRIVRGALAALVVAAATACSSDRATAPTAVPTTPGLRASLSSGGGGSAGGSGMSETHFVIKPYLPTQIAINGGHRVFIPVNATCDPATSGYGPGDWERPCAPAMRSIAVTAYSWIDANGRPAVRFEPDLRFTPDDSKPVYLQMMDRVAAGDPSYTIVYCPSEGAACVDESLTDPEVVTKFNPANRFLYRRVKHFSGYNIVSGRAAAAAE